MNKPIKMNCFKLAKTSIFLLLVLLPGCTRELSNIQCGYLASCPEGYLAQPFGFDCISCTNPNDTFRFNLTDICKGVN